MPYTSKLATLEKYKTLSDSDKVLLGTVENESPEITIARVDADNEKFQAVKNKIGLLVVILSFCSVAFSLGIPHSFIGFLGGVLAFFFVGFVLAFIFYALVEIAFLIISKSFIEKSARQRFCRSISEKWETVQKIKADEDEKIRWNLQIEKVKASQEFQKDYDEIVNYFASGKSMLMPQSRLRFTLDELAANAINQTRELASQKNNTEQKRSEIVAYYRGVTALLHAIEEDKFVDLENSLQRISELMADKTIQDTTKSELMKEYLNISGNDLLKESRKSRLGRKFLSDFDKAFGTTPSLS